MSTKKSQLGEFGEEKACEYLFKKSYKIIERNFRRPFGEIDIIAKAPDKTLVFVEVKSMTDNNSAIRQSTEQLVISAMCQPTDDPKPEDQMTKSKFKKVAKTAGFYAGNFPEKVNEKMGWRIDLITLIFRPSSTSTINDSNVLTISNDNILVNHYEDVSF